MTLRLAGPRGPKNFPRDFSLQGHFVQFCQQSMV